MSVLNNNGLFDVNDNIFDNFIYSVFSTQFHELVDAKQLDRSFHNKNDDALQQGKMSNIVLSRKSTFERQQDNSSEKVK